MNTYLYKLGNGTNYILNTTVFGNNVFFSDTITATGEYNFTLGQLSLRLTNDITGNTINGFTVNFFRKRNNGTLAFATSSKTDSKGYVRTSLKFNNNQVYIAQFRNALGDGKAYFSQILSSGGTYDVALNPDTSPIFADLDREAPDISVHTPVSGATVGQSGFTLDGYISDNVEVKTIILTITDPLIGKNQIEVTEEAGYWSTTIPSSIISAGNTITIAATGYDTSLNNSTATVSYSVINDQEGPSITANSPTESDWILHNGFIIQGDVTDNTTVESLTATVIDSAMGTLVSQQAIEFSTETGNWTFVGPETTAGGTVAITIQATDPSGNISSKVLTLKTRANSLNGVQLINRATFGAVPGMYEYMAEVGPEQWLTEQLSPNSIDNTELDSILDSKSFTSKVGVRNYRILQARYSERQLQEVMAEFWDNHFNTDINDTNQVSSELRTNNYYRNNAFGYFGDLLKTTAKSSTMLLFLDNNFNYKDAPNENYGRELLEIHTVGVTGYTQEDVVEAAKVFTGWHVYWSTEKEFIFYPSLHDDSEATVLNLTIPAGSGVEGGEMLLDYLATHPSTAEHLCTKLSQLFVRDNPPTTLINSCSDAWIESGGHIGTVVELILRSDAFNNTYNEHRKVKTPFKFLIGLNRNFDLNSSLEELRTKLNEMGMPIASRPSADSYPETGESWSNSNQMVQHISYATRLIFSPTGRANYTYLPSLADQLEESGYETAEGVTGYLFKLMLANDYSEEEWNQAITLLTINGTNPFLITNDNAEMRVRFLVRLIAGFPSYQLQ